MGGKTNIFVTKQPQPPSPHTFSLRKLVEGHPSQGIAIEEDDAVLGPGDGDIEKLEIPVCAHVYSTCEYSTCEYQRD